LYWAQNRYAEAEPLFVRVLEARERLLGAEHPDVLFSLEFYLSWRAAAARDGLKSFWRGDEAALRLLRELLPSFDRYLAGGANAARLPDPSSREARASRLFSAFEQARFSGVAGSDDPQIVSSASALSQRFNLSSVAAALSASSQRLADPKRRALLDERTRLGREIDDRFKALAKLQSAPTRVPAGEASIQADIEDLQKQAAAITAELRDGDQGQAEIDGVIVEEDLAKVGAALGADEALVAYTSVGGRYLAFVTTRKGSTAVSLDVERDAIAKEVTALRGGLRLPFRVVNGKEIASNNPNDLPAYDLEAAKMLHAQLIAPLTHYLAGVKRLVIVPDGPLQSLPFGVLVEDVGDAALMGFERYQSARYLIDRYAVSMQPSVSAIRALRAKTPRAGGDLAMLGFADPALGGVEKKNIILPMSGIGDAKRLEDLPELPQMKSLLSVVGAALKARPEDLRFREKAQEADFRAYDAALPRYRMLTFATHGLVSNEIKALNLEEPALVMSLPPAKAGQKRPAENDGLLRASDIVGFEMDADLVILAACNTAAADGTPGAEPLSGLAKAFMAKGARALLVSHWQADANSSAVLIPAMARYAETDGFAVGLAKAQRDLRANAAFDPDPLSNTLHHAHPAIWGAFTLIGDPGR
jgi:CHAT domain-containing protein